MEDAIQATTGASQTNDATGVPEPVVKPVTVTVIATDDGGHHCKPNPILVKVGTPALLAFTFAQGEVDYVFDEVAITFETPTLGQFEPPNTLDNGAMATLLDVASLPGTFKYKVHVKDKNGKPISFDPLIENEA